MGVLEDSFEYYYSIFEYFFFIINLYRLIQTIIVLLNDHITICVFQH